MTGSPMLDLWRRARWLFLALACAIAYGVAGYMLLEGWSVLDALYMTITTLTTVGFREVRPLGSTGMVFTLSVITIGVGLVLVTITVVAQWVLEGRWSEQARRKRMQRRIDELSGHFIVCAYGRVGRAVARELESEGARFVVIDPDEDLVERMTADGVPYLIEDPSQEPVLRDAGVERARGLVCAVDSDATNVYITLIARSMNPDLFIVARASEPGSDQRLRKAGADRVVSPFVSSGRHMALVALRPRVSDVVELEAPGTASIKLEEVRIDAGSGLVGRTVHEALGSTPVLAIRHAGGQVTAHPSPDLMLHEGDLVLLLGEADLAAVRRPAPLA
ncbi:MAG TPA: potassium channel protein [Actinomycetota bacterium]|nr:potassium channel protein [Actinomycetota bacterium]